MSIDGTGNDQIDELIEYEARVAERIANLQRMYEKYKVAGNNLAATRTLARIQELKDEIGETS